MARPGGEAREDAILARSEGHALLAMAQPTSAALDLEPAGPLEASQLAPSCPAASRVQADCQLAGDRRLGYKIVRSRAQGTHHRATAVAINRIGYHQQDAGAAALP